MADGRDDRHRARGNGDRQVEIVEAGKVHLRPAAAQDQQGVIRPLLRVRKRGNNGRRGLFPLHQSFVQVKLEGVSRLIFKQMPPEIAISRRGLGSNDGEPVRQGRERKFLLHLQIPPGGELLDGLLLRQRLLPHREGRVDFVDEQGHPELLAEMDLDPYQDGDSRLERLAGLLLEEGLEHRIVPLPDHGPDVGDGFPPVALGQVQVAVAVGPRTPGADLRLHPVSVGESVLDAFLHAGEQFRQLQVVLCHRPISFSPSATSPPSESSAPARRPARRSRRRG